MSEIANCVHCGSNTAAREPAGWISAISSKGPPERDGDESGMGTGEQAEQVGLYCLRAGSVAPSLGRSVRWSL